jgi:hypothetical protein
MPRDTLTLRIPCGLGSAGGWDRIGDDLRAGAAQLDAPPGHGVSLATLFQPNLLLGFPVALFRYPASIAVKSPVTFALLLALLALGLPSPADPAAADAAASGLYLDLFQALGLAGLETLFLGRVFLVALLEERNYVLARNIRRAAIARPQPRQAGGGGAGRSGRTVVAVLGMAHLNGVRQILTSSRVV